MEVWNIDEIWEEDKMCKKSKSRTRLGTETKDDLSLSLAIFIYLQSLSFYSGCLHVGFDETTLYSRRNGGISYLHSSKDIGLSETLLSFLLKVRIEPDGSANIIPQ